MRKKWIATLVALVLFVGGWLAGVQLVVAGELSVGAGVSYTTGTYDGSASTQIVKIPFVARYEGDAWILQASVPYLRITGPGNVIPGIGPIGAATGAVGNILGLPLGQSAPSQTSKTVSGLGDASVSATYMLYGANRDAGVGLTGKLKFATGDETQSLGTGSNDTSVQLEVFRRFDRNTIFAGVGYTAFGDSPIARFENVANVAIGAHHRMDGGDLVGLAFDARQAGSPAPAPLRELTAFWTHPVDSGWRTQLYALKGFARGSPDWGAGINLAYAF